MGTPKPVQISSLVVVAVLLGAGVVDGYFLSHFAPMEHVQQARQPAFEIAMNKPKDEKDDAESDDSKSSAVAKEDAESDDSKSSQKEEEAADAPQSSSWLPKVRDVHRHAAQISPNDKAKYPIIAFFDYYLEKAFGKYTDHWYMDWKFSVGIVLWAAVWAKWLYYGYDEIYYQRALFTFGINIWILHELQYASTVKIGMLVVCIVLSIQTCFQTWIWYHVDAPKDELQDFDCDTLYLDIKLPGVQIAVLFIAQFGVWWFYMTSILGNFNFSEVNYLFWVWAYLVMQMTMIFNRGDDSVLGNPFPVHDVHRIMNNTSKVTFGLMNEDGEVEGERFGISRFDIIARGVTGFFVNAILREIMAYTIPLMLMGFSEPMDFVVYCVGVNFICTLDDKSGCKYSMTTIKDQTVDAEAIEATAEKTT